MSIETICSSTWSSHTPFYLIVHFSQDRLSSLVSSPLKSPTLPMRSLHLGHVSSPLIPHVSSPPLMIPRHRRLSSEAGGCMECDSTSSERVKLANINPFSPSARGAAGRKRNNSQKSLWWVFIIVNIVPNEFPNMKTKTSLREQRHAACWLFARVTWWLVTVRFQLQTGATARQVTSDQVTVTCQLCHIAHWYDGANIAITDMIPAICWRCNLSRRALLIAQHQQN